MDQRGFDLRRRIAVAATYRRSEAISLANDSFNETRLFRIVPEHHADLADSGVNAVVDVEKNVLAPKAFSNLFAGYQFAVPLEQQDKQLHWKFLQAQAADSALEPIAASVQCELTEMECLGREFTSSARSCVAEIMRHDPPRSNCNNSLASYPKFISPL
ncbi:MAG TPA: hypothetical protein VGK01_17535 [Candidatus Angelobacter sp.]